MKCLVPLSLPSACHTGGVVLQNILCENQQVFHPPKKEMGCILGLMSVQVIILRTYTKGCDIASILHPNATV